MFSVWRIRGSYRQRIGCSDVTTTDTIHVASQQAIFIPQGSHLSHSSDESYRHSKDHSERNRGKAAMLHGGSGNAGMRQELLWRGYVQGSALGRAYRLLLLVLMTCFLCVRGSTKMWNVAPTIKVAG